MGVLLLLIILLLLFGGGGFYVRRPGYAGWGAGFGDLFYVLAVVILIVIVLRFAGALTLQIPPAIPIVYASELVVWDEGEDGGVPKGVVGQDGVRCTAESTNGDLTYRTTFYIGADGDEMASNPSRERAWQREHCQNHSELMHGWFWDRRNLPHQPVRIAVRGV